MGDSCLGYYVMMNLSLWNICIFGGGAALLSAVLMHLRHTKRLSGIHTQIHRLKNETQSLQKAAEQKDWIGNAAKNSIAHKEINKLSKFVFKIMYK